MNWKSLPWLLATAVLVFGLTREVAWAEEPSSATEIGEQICRTFKVDLDTSTLIETGSRTNEIGQWVMAQQPDGWRLKQTDLAVGQRPTGYPQGYLLVCLGR